jgi:hypothetical protein
MVLSKKLDRKVSASSILESVIALTIISICLYIAAIVFSFVFTKKSSPKFYNTINQVNELFYKSQLNLDSIEYEAENIMLEKEKINENLSEIKLQYKDSNNINFDKKFYILNNEN